MKFMLNINKPLAVCLVILFTLTIQSNGLKQAIKSSTSLLYNKYGAPKTQTDKATQSKLSDATIQKQNLQSSSSTGFVQVMMSFPVLRNQNGAKIIRQQIKPRQIQLNQNLSQSLVDIQQQLYLVLSGFFRGLQTDITNDSTRCQGFIKTFIEQTFQQLPVIIAEFQKGGENAVNLMTQVLSLYSLSQNFYGECEVQTITTQFIDCFSCTIYKLGYRSLFNIPGLYSSSISLISQSIKGNLYNMMVSIGDLLGIAIDYHYRIL